MDHIESQEDRALSLLLCQLRSPLVCHQLSCTLVSRMGDCSKVDHIWRHELFAIAAFLLPTFVRVDHGDSINLDLLLGRRRQLRFCIYSRRVSKGQRYLKAGAELSMLDRCGWESRSFEPSFEPRLYEYRRRMLCLF
jgi:hypothetical protein